MKALRRALKAEAAEEQHAAEELWKSEPQALQHQQQQQLRDRGGLQKEASRARDEVGNRLQNGIPLLCCSQKSYLREVDESGVAAAYLAREVSWHKRPRYLLARTSKTSAGAGIRGLADAQRKRPRSTPYC